MMKNVHNLRRAIYLVAVLAGCCGWQNAFAQGTPPLFGGRTPTSHSNFFFIRGQYNGFTGDDYSFVGSTCDGGVSGVTILATAAANGNQFLIHNDNNKNNGFGNKWGAANVPFGVPANAAHQFGPNSNMASAFVAGSYYSFRATYKAFTGNRIAVHSTTFKPTQFTHVSAIDGKVVGCLDKAPAAVEYLYLRYSTNGGTSYTTVPIVPAGVAGTTGADARCFTITVPAVSYTFYVMNSTLATVAAVNAAPAADVDLYSLNDYGTDVNGSGVTGGNANADCNKLSNFRTRTNIKAVCVPEGGYDVTLTDNATIDGCKYQLAKESDFATPLNDPTASTTQSDFTGESSAFTYYTDAAFAYGDNANRTNWNNPTSTQADIKNLSVSWDNTYLYLLTEGNTNWNNAGANGDIMDLFILIDTDNDKAATAYTTGTNVANTSLPYNKRVDCNGWRPNYVVAIEKDDVGGGDYASLHSVGAGAPVLKDDTDDTAERACDFDYRQVDAKIEVRVPWSAIGGAPSAINGQTMNFAMYTTYDADGYDTYDSAPGLGQGHGKPFEQIGDTPWDGDHWGGHVDPVTGTNDATSTAQYGESYNADPFDAVTNDQGPGDNQSNSQNGRQPSSDRTALNGTDAADFDTIEEYWSIKNVGQISSEVACVTLPDGGAAVTIACTAPLPSQKVGTALLAGSGCLVDDNPYTAAYDPYATAAQTLAFRTQLNATAFVTAGGAISYTSGGGLCKEQVIITAADVETGRTFSAVGCSACAGLKEIVTRTYTLTHVDKIVTNVPCSPVTKANKVTTCVQTFTRTPDGANCALPVNLLFFDADLKGNDVLLTWTTSSEQNADKFNVQRSIDGDNFETIGSVKAAGNSNIRKNYNFTDANINQNMGRIYYRIQSVDLDGRSKVWDIRTVKLRADVYTLNIVPNPAQDVVRISVAALVSANTQLNIYNIMGQSVYSQNFTPAANTPNNFEVDLSAYSKGIYQVVVRSGSNIASQKLIVK